MHVHTICGEIILWNIPTFDNSLYYKKIIVLYKLISVREREISVLLINYKLIVIIIINQSIIIKLNTSFMSPFIFLYFQI